AVLESKPKYKGRLTSMVNTEVAAASLRARPSPRAMIRKPASIGSQIVRLSSGKLNVAISIGRDNQTNRNHESMANKPRIMAKA
ncbi:MAG: hypothetical protein ACI9XK_004521, partial [Granulosicoccus sp.]